MRHACLFLGVLALAHGSFAGTQADERSAAARAAVDEAARALDEGAQVLSRLGRRTEALAGYREAAVLWQGHILLPTG